MLKTGGFALENVYESVRSAPYFEDILKAYVDSVNREPEDIGEYLRYARRSLRTLILVQ